MKFLEFIFRWGLSTAFLVLGPFFFFGGVLIVLGGWSSNAWPHVSGTILSSKIVEHRGRNVSFSPQIRYQYRVGSQSFESGAITLFDFGGDEARAREIVARFPPGATAPVFHDPAAPGRAVLMPGAHWFMFATAGMGLVAFLVGAAVTPLREKLRKKKAPPDAMREPRPGLAPGRGAP